MCNVHVCFFSVDTFAYFSLLKLNAPLLSKIWYLSERTFWLRIPFTQNFLTGPKYFNQKDFPKFKAVSIEALKIFPALSDKFNTFTNDPLKFLPWMRLFPWNHKPNHRENHWHRMWKRSTLNDVKRTFHWLVFCVKHFDLLIFLHFPERPPSIESEYWT